jgi:hypothetical protein
VHTAKIGSDNFPGGGATKNKTKCKIIVINKTLYAEKEENNNLMKNVHRICTERNKASKNWNVMTEYAEHFQHQHHSNKNNNNYYSYNNNNNILTLSELCVKQRPCNRNQNQFS